MTKVTKIEIPNKPEQTLNLSFGKFYSPLSDAMLNATYEGGKIYLRFMENEWHDPRPVKFRMFYDGQDLGQEHMIYLNSLDISDTEQLHIFYI